MGATGGLSAGVLALATRHGWTSHPWHPKDQRILLKAIQTQPISHRLDHIMSGIRAQVAVKIYGEDLDELRQLANEVRVLMEDIDGVVDLQVEQQVRIEQIRVTVLRQEAIRYGLPPEDVAEAVIFLCSDGASYITGQVLTIDGGMIA